MHEPSNFQFYVANMQEIALEKELNWHLPINIKGRVPKSERWSLNEFLAKPPPPAFWIDNFSVHEPTKG